MAKIKEIVGDVPGVRPAAATAPPPGAGTGARHDRHRARRRPGAERRRRGPDEPCAVGADASAIWVLIAGVVGLAAAFTLTVEKIELLENPAYVPSCSINPVLSCGSVMVTPQAEAFGFPNPLIGIVAFTVVVVTGVLARRQSARCRGGIGPGWRSAHCSVSVFVHWLIFQSLYVIGALCPYCMVVWAVTIPLLVVVASIALRPLRR